MKKHDHDGRQLIVDVPDNKISQIREVIYGSGKTLKEKKKAQEEEQKLRLDEKA